MRPAASPHSTARLAVPVDGAAPCELQAVSAERNQQWASHGGSDSGRAGMKAARVSTLSPVRPSFDQIYEEYLPYVWRTVLRMGIPEQYAEDATQEVFIVVHRQLGEFEGRSKVKTWLFSIAFRITREWLRRLRRARSEELPAELSDDTGPGPFEGALRRQKLAVLYELLSTLDPDKREAFILGELEQMSVPEIAEVLGANINTVASRLRAARRAFEAAVQRRDARLRKVWP
jgi:RNA polymerase sigma-70 factor, ECF subfamily